MTPTPLSLDKRGRDPTNPDPSLQFSHILHPAVIGPPQAHFVGAVEVALLLVPQRPNVLGLLKRRCYWSPSGPMWWDAVDGAQTHQAWLYSIGTFRGALTLGVNVSTLAAHSRASMNLGLVPRSSQHLERVSPYCRARGRRVRGCGVRGRRVSSGDAFMHEWGCRVS